MSWPATSANVGYLVQGISTIKFGTEGILQLPIPAAGSFFTVTKATQKQLVDNIKLPNGVGPTATRVQIVDGTQWNLTVRDDSRMIPPQIGSTWTLVDIGNMIPIGGVPPNNTNANSVYVCTIVENDYEAAIKTPGERTVTVEMLTLVEASAAGPQPH